MTTFMSYSLAQSASRVKLPKNSKSFELKQNASVAQLAKTNTSVFKSALKFNLTGMNYFSDSSADQSFQQNINLDLDVKGSRGEFFYKTQAVMGLYSEVHSDYYAVPEVFIGYGQTQNYKLTVGREIFIFNELDQFSNLGLFNSYFSNDLINYKMQGLIGLHFLMHQGGWGIQAGINPIYLPNQGPQVHEKDGHITSTNRWAPRPPTEFQFNNENKPIQYAIRNYSFSEIIFHPGETFSFFYGDSPQRPLVKLSYAYKPVNEIALSRENYGDTNKNMDVHVNLSPVVTYQTIKSVDFNLQPTNAVSTTLSYIDEQPYNQEANEYETRQWLNPMKIYGITSAIDLQNFLNNPIHLILGYSIVEGGTIQDLTQGREPGLFTFSKYRTQFQHPLTIGLQSENQFFKLKKATVTNVKWTYDQKVKGSLFSLNISQEAFDQVRMNVGCDILGVRDINDEVSVDSFLSKNQSHDRIFGGLEYVY